MKYSRLFGKTVREPQSDMTITSHKLLYQAGFIRESRAGRYYFLPLGQRVHDKMCAIIEAEMNTAGAQKMFAPVLHPIELWQETNRDSAGGYELMTVTDRNGAKFALGGTAEEMFVDVVRGFNLSYKDLPINLYQFGYKFRDELRARGGLLRVREFVMKDAYSFHTTNEDFEIEYNKMWQAYLNSYSKIGLDVKVVPADNGYFGGEYCHEFVAESKIGESTFFESENGDYIAHEDIAKFDYEDLNPEEELLEMQKIDQPAWVKTMEDNLKHYKKPLFQFLKNVVYKNRLTSEIFIAVVRGDLEVNKNKLEAALGLVGLLEDATAEDLEKIGTKTGFVNAWGHKDCTYIADKSLYTVKNFIGGQKTETTDSINVNYGRDFKHELEADIAKAQAGFKSPVGTGKLIEKRGIEVGNIFQLGQHYSTKMKDAVFADATGVNVPFYMGCYGIGVGRTLATVVETFADDKGIVWPKSITPYHVHMIAISQNPDNIAKIESIYSELLATGIQVLLDDREVRPGVKFADADLIGIPLRVVLSDKTLAESKFELKHRSNSEAELQPISNLVSYIQKFYAD